MYQGATVMRLVSDRGSIAILIPPLNIPMDVTTIASCNSINKASFLARLTLVNGERQIFTHGGQDILVHSTS